MEIVGFLRSRIHKLVRDVRNDSFLRNAWTAKESGKMTDQDINSLVPRELEKTVERYQRVKHLLRVDFISTGCVMVLYGILWAAAAGVVCGASFLAAVVLLLCYLFAGVFFSYSPYRSRLLGERDQLERKLLECGDEEG